MSEPTTLERSRLPRALRLYNVAARLGVRPRLLSAERVVRRARRKTGLHDLGEGAADVLEALAVLTDSLEREAGLSPVGIKGMNRLLERLLKKRLEIVAALRSRPAVMGEVIRRPIFVLGFPRTGTTLLYNLLAQDPAARPLLGWEAFDPIPPIHARRPSHPGRDPRIARFRRAMRGLRYVAPELHKVHPIAGDGPEECMSLLLRTFVSLAFVLQVRVPSYEDWYWSRDVAVLETAYRFHRDQLRLLQAQRRGGHWLLKSPAHIDGIEALARVYPDACIVQTHRDPAKVLPSVCSLLAMSRKIQSDAVDPVVTAGDVLRAADRKLARLYRVLDELPAARVRHVSYAGLMEDPLATVRGIYEHHRIPMSGEMEARMARWLEENPRHKHGVHRYSLEQFGIGRAELERAAAVYRERFDVAAEA